MTNSISSKDIPQILHRLKSKVWIYIDNKYTLIDTHSYTYSDNPTNTLIELNEWINDDILKYEVRLENEYKKEYQKMCLLSEEQLKQRGFI